jgi:hypothetical protein
MFFQLNWSPDKALTTKSGAEMVRKDLNSLEISRRNEPDRKNSPPLV